MADRMKLMVKALRGDELPQDAAQSRLAGPAPAEHPVYEDTVTQVKALKKRVDDFPVGFQGRKGGGVVTYRGTFG
jgi:hypothetical protein